MKYSYTKIVNILQLENEILASSIVVALDYIDIKASALDVYMKAELSVGDKTTLDGLVTNHVIDTAIVEDKPDSDGNKVVRLKAAKKGFTYHLHYLCFSTSKLDSLQETNFEGTPINYSDIKFKKYTLDADANPILPLVDCSENMADVTIVDFVPPFQFEIIGGEVRVYEKPVQDTFLYVIAAPDIPAPFGSKIMVQNCNLKFYDRGEPIVADGKVAKNMNYITPGLPDGLTNKIRFYIRHLKGAQLQLQARIEMFKL